MPKPPTTPFRLRESKALRLLSVSFGIFFYWLLQSTAAVQAQSCPSNILGLPLAGSSGASSVDCLTVEGSTICSLWCWYSNRDVRNIAAAEMTIKWVSSARAGAPILEDSCGPTPNIPYGQRHANRQAKARWWGNSLNLETAVEIEALKLLKLVGESAVACTRVSMRTNQEDGGGLPPPPPYCNSSKPQGKIRNPTGKVELYAYAFDKWKGPITSEFPVMPCDRVRTGSESSATVFIYTPSGAEDRIDLSSNTILEIPGLSEWETEHNTPPSEGFFTDLIQGTIRWVTPETPGERRRREQANSEVFNVRTPTITTGRRGTDFVLRHDPLEKKDYLLLNEGSVEVSTGGEKVVLVSGQQIYTENKRLSAVYEMKPDVWKSVIARTSIPGPKDFAGARQIETASAGKDGSKANDGGKGKEDPKGGVPNDGKVAVMFQGRRYITLYQRQTHERTPIDLYFFEIRAPDGSHAEQDGAKLWGRFVRSPAVGIETKDGTQWWYVDWIFKSGRWEAVTTKGEPFQVLSPGN